MAGNKAVGPALCLGMIVSQLTEVPGGVSPVAVRSQRVVKHVKTCTNGGRHQDGDDDGQANQ